MFYVFPTIFLYGIIHYWLMRARISSSVLPPIFWLFGSYPKIHFTVWENMNINTPSFQIYTHFCIEYSPHISMRDRLYHQLLKSCRALREIALLSTLLASSTKVAYSVIKQLHLSKYDLTAFDSR